MVQVSVALLTLVVRASVTVLTPVPIGTEVTGIGDTTTVETEGEVLLS